VQNVASSDLTINLPQVLQNISKVFHSGANISDRPLPHPAQNCGGEPSDSNLIDLPQRASLQNCWHTNFCKKLKAVKHTSTYKVIQGKLVELY